VRTALATSALRSVVSRIEADRFDCLKRFFTGHVMSNGVGNNTKFHFYF
jgi:hypothetical protein